jgi:uncharacterized membrane protein
MSKQYVAVTYVTRLGGWRLAFPNKVITSRTIIHIAVMLFAPKVINEQLNKAGEAT